MSTNHLRWLGWTRQADFCNDMALHFKHDAAVPFYFRHDLGAHNTEIDRGLLRLVLMMDEERQHRATNYPDQPLDDERWLPSQLRVGTGLKMRMLPYPDNQKYWTNLDIAYRTLSWESKKPPRQGEGPWLKLTALEQREDNALGELAIEVMANEQVRAFVFWADVKPGHPVEWQLLWHNTSIIRTDPEYAQGPVPDDLRFLLMLLKLPPAYQEICLSLIPGYLRTAIEVATNRLAHGLPPDDTGRPEYRNVWPR